MLRENISALLERATSYIVIGIVFLLPLFFLPLTTDFIELPKQALLLSVTLVLLVLLSLKFVLKRKVTVRRSPFDLALLILFVVVLASGVLAVGPFSQALPSALPLASLVLFSYLLVNIISRQEDERLLISALLAAGALLAILNVLQFLKIYILPYPIAQAPGFSLSGSILSSSLFLVCLLPLGIAFSRTYFKSKDELWSGFFIGTTAVIAVGLAIGLYQLATAARPIILPQSSGLRTAIQPLGLSFQTAMVGTGPGTYLADFTRFRDVVLNNTNLWSLRFTSSSSFFFELVATLGLIGAITFLFIIFRLFSSFLKGWARALGSQTIGVFLSLVLCFLLSFFLPFSFSLLFLLFTLLSLYVVRLAYEKNPHVFDVSISVVALREGLISFTPIHESGTSQPTRLATDILPYIFLIASLAASGVLFFGMYRFLASDILFQRALVEAANNRARETYDLQLAAINTFPNRDMYHRIFSQTNLAIANSIALQARLPDGQAQGATPTALTDQQRQSIVTLVQQSIQFSRNAVTLSPLNVLNWENLTNIYRALIGFAQNADQFAIASARQAIALDQTNPLLRINLGGIYYQLGQYDIAISEFANAINLKPDHANAYYNLGHGFEAKGDPASLQAALDAYLRVRTLIDPASEDFKRIDAEIAALSARISPPPPQATPTAQPATEQEPLTISAPSATLPTQKPPVPVEGPPPPATTAGEQR